MCNTKTAITCHFAMPNEHPGDFCRRCPRMLATRFNIDHTIFEIDVG